MAESKIRWLRAYLFVGGLASAIGLSFVVPLFFGDLLLWHPRNLPDELMISCLYFSMGIVMVAASRRPLASHVFVDFLILGNTLHAAVMIFFGENWRHIVLDAGAVGLLGLLPLLFYPWGLRRFLRYSSSHVNAETTNS